MPYILSQCAGALVASALLRVMFSNVASLGATLPLGGNEMQSFVLEITLTFILMLVILGVTSGPKEVGVMAGIAIGGVIGLEALFAGPISGASMNPARSLAPALVSGNLTSLWVYLTAPILGALLAVPAARLTGVFHREGG
jgi:aquaporin Z